MLDARSPWFRGSAPLALSLVVAVVAIVARPVAAQCATQWLPGSTLGSGTSGTVNALLTLPNGSLVAGGTFTSAGGVPVNHVAVFDGTAWAPLGTGTNNFVYALARLPNGDLIAGGQFTSAGGVPCNRIARWNGSSWSPLGSGTSSFVYALATLPNGDLVAGGAFATAGGVLASNVARWNGASWSGLGVGTDGLVAALAVSPTGDLLAGGYFTTAGGTPCSQVARWNGVAWSPLGAGTNGAVFCLRPLPNDDVIAGGLFATADGLSCNRIARWNGATWAALAAGTDSQVTALTTLPNGDLVAGGYFTAAGGLGASAIARWNGSSWSPFGGGLAGAGTVAVLALSPLANGDVAAGGIFTSADGLAANSLARLSTTCPATATPFGVGCAEANGPDVLTADTLPWVDTTFRATGTGLPTVAIVLTLTSVTAFPQGTAPLALLFAQAGVDCDVLAAPDLLGLLVTTNGSASSTLLLPNSPPLVGVTFYHQFLSIEVDPQGAWTSVTATNALQLLAGSF